MNQRGWSDLAVGRSNESPRRSRIRRGVAISREHASRLGAWALRLAWAWLIAGLLPGLLAEEKSDPKPIPTTRPQLKASLEALKRRQPRLPLPPPSDEDRLSGDARRLVNNGRMRRYYLGDEFTRGAFPRDKDPHLTLDYAFTVELFWIASRVNNCHYCLGHQENKLLQAGRSENRIAALDADWSFFTEAEKAAFTFAKKLTFEPHRVSEQDLESLRKFYEPRQIVEICFHVAGYNAMNRWTDSLGIPQEDHREFETATSTAFTESPSQVAPAVVPDRGPLESREWVEHKLSECAERDPRLPLVDAEHTREILGLSAETPVPAWMRLLANFPVAGKAKIESLIAVRTKGRLSQKLRAQIDWASARHDRAWYALADARSRLRSLGMTDDEIFALTEPGAETQNAEKVVMALAAKLTSAPQSIVDQDIVAVREHFSDHETAEIVHYITQAAFMNRITETAWLRAEP